MGAMCGSSQGSLPNEKSKIIVTGDIQNTDTRNILSVLEIGEVEFIFKQIQTNGIDAAINSQFQNLNTQQETFIDTPSQIQLIQVDEIARHTPVIEDNGRRYLGNSQEILIHCCLRDQRNSQKFDLKGKPIKVKKGTPKIPSLYPEDKQQNEEVLRMLNWFSTKLRPHTQHLYFTISNILGRQNAQSHLQVQEIQEYDKVVNQDMDHIIQALKALDQNLKNKRYLAASNALTVVDIVIYNELVQTLFIYSQFQKNQKARNFQNLNEENEIQPIHHLKNVTKWIESTIKIGDSNHKALQNYDNQARNLFLQQFN